MIEKTFFMIWQNISNVKNNVLLNKKYKFYILDSVFN